MNDKFLSEIFIPNSFREHLNLDRSDPNHKKSQVAVNTLQNSQISGKSLNKGSQSSFHTEKENKVRFDLQNTQSNSGQFNSNTFNKSNTWSFDRNKPN